MVDFENPRAACDDEELLSGGNVNHVTRVGNTVRRTAGAWTPTIHRLLSHARRKGLSWVPEPHGLDDVGREILSFIPGEVPHHLPNWVWSDAILGDVGRALREWHDATADFDVTGAIWNLDVREPREVVCHNDFAPYNCVFRDRRFVGAIDFDVCAPGPRIWDLAYTAYRFVPLMPEADREQQARPSEASPFAGSVQESRLTSFLAAYGAMDAIGLYEGKRVVMVAVERLEAIAGWTEEHVRARGAAALEGHAALYRQHAEWLRSWSRTSGG